jgi:hypothetical protein
MSTPRPVCSSWQPRLLSRPVEVITLMTQDRSDARLIHHVPGRLRVRLHDAVPMTRFGTFGAVRVAPGVEAVEVRESARSIVVRYAPDQTSLAAVLTAFSTAGLVIDDGTGDDSARSPDARGNEGQGNGGATLRELLIGPPPKLDRRFAESLALSLVSLLGARQVGLALGGGMTMPAYFVIWLTLRRLTGAGRRR